MKHYQATLFRLMLLVVSFPVLANSSFLPADSQIPESLHVQITKLFAGDGEPDDNFGYSLALSGTTAVVGAWQNDAPDNNSGAVYVFERNALNGLWSQVIKLRPDDGDTGDEFGRAVAIDGNWLVVGAQWDDDAGNDRGAAYIFGRTPQGVTPWTRTAKLTADDSSFRDFFGRTVAISGTKALIGAPEDNTQANGSNSGSAYVFERNPLDGSWNQIDKLIADDGEASDLFGSAIAISGDTVIVGASEHSPNDTNNAGAVYVFERDAVTNTWNQSTKLTAADADERDEFGFAVALSDGVALVGAPFDDDAGTVGGSAYVFERASAAEWMQTDKLEANDAALGDNFGYSVALSGIRALVGARWDDDGGDDSGSAYLFQRRPGDATWRQFDKLAANDGASEDWFGFAVSLTERYAFVGAHQDDDQMSEESGSGYLFRHDDLIMYDGFED